MLEIRGRISRSAREMPVNLYKVRIFFYFFILFSVFSLSLAEAGERTVSFVRKELYSDYITSFIDSIDDPCSKSEALIAVSRTGIYLKDHQNARRILGSAFEIVDDVKEQFSKAIILTEIVDQYIKLNELNKARAAAARIGLADSQGEAEIRIMNAFLKSGQHKKALLVAKGIEDPFSQALAFHGLIDDFMALGVYEYASQAKEFIEKSVKLRTLIRLIASRNEDHKRNQGISTNYYIMLFKPLTHTRMLIRMAKESILKGSFERAREILSYATEVAERIGSYYVKSDMLANIAVCYIEMGDLRSAREGIDSVPHMPSKSAPLAKLAAAYVESGEYDTALSITERIDTEFFKEEVYELIIKRFLDAGREKEVFRLVNLLKGGFSRGRLYNVIVSRYVHRDEFKKASAVVKSIKDPLARIKCLSELARNIDK